MFNPLRLGPSAISDCTVRSFISQGTQMHPDDLPDDQGKRPADDLGSSPDEASASKRQKTGPLNHLPLRAEERVASTSEFQTADASDPITTAATTVAARQPSASETFVRGTLQSLERMSRAERIASLAKLEVVLLRKGLRITDMQLNAVIVANTEVAPQFRDLAVGRVHRPAPPARRATTASAGPGVPQPQPQPQQQPQPTGAMPAQPALPVQPTVALQPPPGLLPLPPLPLQLQAQAQAPSPVPVDFILNWVFGLPPGSVVETDALSQVAPGGVGDALLECLQATGILQMSAAGVLTRTPTQAVLDDQRANLGPSLLGAWKVLDDATRMPPPGGPAAGAGGLPTGT